VRILKKSIKKNNQHGLSKRIVGMTILFDAFFLIIIMAVLAFVYVDTINTERENNAVLVSTNAAAAMQSFIDETRQKVETLAQNTNIKAYIGYLNTDPDMAAIPAKTDSNYAMYSRFIATFNAVWSTSPDGVYDFVFIASETTCADSGDGCFVGVNEEVITSLDNAEWIITERLWYIDAQSDTSAVTVSDPYIDAVSLEYTITFTAKILDDGDTIGYIGIDVNLPSFTYILENYERYSGESDKQMVIFQTDDNDDSTVLFYSDPLYTEYKMLSGPDIAAQDLSIGYAENGLALVINNYTSDGSIFETSIFGDPYFVVYPQLTDIGWRIAVLVDRPATLAVEIMFAILLGSVVILMLLISLILGKRITMTLSPINDILDSIDQIKKGNFDISVKVQENNELKNVADAINIMSKEIGSQMDLVYKSFLYDSITGLKNRRACHQDIEEKVLIGKEKAAICLIDVDNLKNINVTKGQSVGDELLQEFAHQLTLTVAAPDFVFSNGGNEFIFIMPKVKTLDVVERELLKIFERFREPVAIKNIKVEVKCNIGVAIYPYDGKSMDDLIKKCDTALFKAKQAGNGVFVFYNDQITREVNYKAQINEQLAEAIQKEELFLKYQPLIDNKNEIYGFEALARWNSPTLGEIGPQVFISNAEESHLIIPIGTWILREACVSQVELFKHFNRQFVMSVNVSPVQILQKDFIDILRKVILETDIDPHYLVLEITEGILIDSTIYLEETINFIHEIGARIALDDFGTGYASLTYLRKLPFDNLKIDKSFVDGIFSSKKDHSIIGTIVQLVHNLNMIVIAEGVETRKQYEFLKQITTDVFQGFLFSKALNLEETIKYVDQFYKVNKTKRIDVFANKDYTE